MKKIKLLTSLSTLGVLGGGVAVSATSCSEKKDGEETKKEGKYLAVSDFYEGKFPAVKDKDAYVTLYELNNGQVENWENCVKSVKADYDESKIKCTYHSGYMYSYTFCFVLADNYTATEGDTIDITFTAVGFDSKEISLKVTYTFANHYYCANTLFDNVLNISTDQQLVNPNCTDFANYVEINDPDGILSFDEDEIPDIFADNGKPKFEHGNFPANPFFIETTYLTYTLKQNAQEGTYIMPYTWKTDESNTLTGYFILTVQDADL